MWTEESNLNLFIQKKIKGKNCKQYFEVCCLHIEFLKIQRVPENPLALQKFKKKGKKTPIEIANYYYLTTDINELHVVFRKQIPENTLRLLPCPRTCL
jgi:hypothetical protein